MKKIIKIIAVVFAALLIVQTPWVTWNEASIALAADVSENDSSSSSSTTDYTGISKSSANKTLSTYANNLILINELDEIHANKITAILTASKKTIDAWEYSTDGDLGDYVTTIEAQMDAVIAQLPGTTSDFLALSDEYQTPTVKYGDTVTIMLPVISYASVSLSDVMVKPEISNLVAEWPFEPDAAGMTKSIKSFPPYDSSENMEDVRQDIGFTFKVRSDVLNGYYPLKFDFTYNRQGTIETTTIVTYVKTIGKDGSESLDGQSDDSATTSKPRIIVTGFDTNPEKVNAGDTFTVTIHVQNTSQEEAVKNVLFDLQAVIEGTDKTDTYAAFLPTSGSSSVYFDNIPAKQTKDIVMEMEARSDLSEKPYVLDVNMKYDCKDAVDLTDTASVSVPIYQVSRCETGDAEVLPASISVGEQSDVTFDVYNTGKTTLNNTWVKFKGDSITGGDTYLGNISPGNTANMDTMLTGAAATTDDGTITAEISYENESGDVTTVEKTVTLIVTDTMSDGSFDMGDGAMIDPSMDGDMGTGSASFGISKVIIIVVVAIIILVVVILVIRKRKKRKKLEADELEADENALKEAMEDETKGDDQ